MTGAAPSDRALAPPPGLLTALVEMGVIPAGSPPPMEALTGGVSSEIWRIDRPDGPVVAKQALARLKVAGDWRAPLTRTGFEVAWMRRAQAIWPGVTPGLVAAADGAFVMEWLDPRRHPVWKGELMAGRVEPAVAAAVADRLVEIHAATAGDPAVAAEFANVDVFAALRLDPYFAAAATRHPDRAAELGAIRESYLAHRVALVHGDVSPKNILVGPDGPVLLDAECATWGDPAFDVAFVTTHLLLKAVAVVAAAGTLASAVERLHRHYRAGLDWEEPDGFDRRCAGTVAGLLLARVDGLSPVEYLDRVERATVRAAARQLLADPPATLPALAARWGELTGTGSRR